MINYLWENVLVLNVNLSDEVCDMCIIIIINSLPNL